VLTSGTVDDHQVSDNSFGLFIAYVLPGFTAMHGLPLATSSISGWSSIFTTPSPSVVDLIIVVLQATTVGLVVSTVRWITVDTLHHRTGLIGPSWNVAKMEHGVAMLELLIQIHYRYYKFYANMAVALLASLFTPAVNFTWGTVFLHTALTALFLFASRDALRKYYQRTAVLFSAD
jgi:hypothetical protein